MPMRDPYDRNSKWMIGHQGGAVLRLGGASGFTAWRAVQAELVVPKKMPDGLLEVDYPGKAEPDLYLVEITTYPDRDVERQAVEDALLVYLDRGKLPEVLILVLCPRGQVRVADQRGMSSPHGWTHLSVRWRVVELWTLPAADQLAANDVGLIPWVPLMQFDGPAETILRECRDRIERQAPPEQRESLLAVAAMLGSLRYDESLLATIFEGRQGVLEIPLLDKMIARHETERQRRDIVCVLATRFGTVPPEITAALQGVSEETRLEKLLAWSAACPDVDAFRARLAQQGQ
jgi:hypothetical protein